MSLLTETLTRIMAWMQEHTPQYAQSFLPGLPQHRIQELSERLDIPFPTELYELYKWRNGTYEESNRMNALLVFHFSPLEQMVATYEQMNSDKENVYFILQDGSRLFPISDDGGDYITFLVPQEANILQTPIALFDRESAYGYLAFQSCATLMQTLEESYRLGALYLDEDGFINEDSHQLLTIIQKYSATTISSELVNVLLQND